MPKERQRVYFDGAENWDNDPRFVTRLDHAFGRVHQFIFHPRIVLLLIVMFFFSLCFIIYPLDPKRLADWIVGAVGTSFLTYVGLVITVFWNLDSVYGRKWQLFYEQWYEVNRMQPGNAQDEQFCNLNMDIITMKLWGDPAISATFKEDLEVAIRNVLKDSPETDVESAINKLRRREMDVYEAHDYFARSCAEADSEYYEEHIDSGSSSDGSIGLSSNRRRMICQRKLKKPFSFRPTHQKQHT
ncbi:MAG TPA: hypothetical protein VFO10_12895 [Oligoflexus sp.]|uniref:hypothetical protein n=1 Tax=Oligoflexus sp. TaxID=1971216 RepID=UPI002D800A7C|nr:hypothetical protein [Oligoflexus sp.]HET9238149.1 hypothetical protein [Oligoflexus sp.]